MRLSIFGYSQKKAVDMGLELDHLMILRWFVDWQKSGGMKTFEAKNGERYYWINAKKIISDLPLLGLSSRQSVYKRLKELVEKDVLKKKTDDKNWTFYSINDSTYSKLCYGENTGGNENSPPLLINQDPCKKFSQPPVKSSYNPLVKKVNNNSLCTLDSLIKDSTDNSKDFQEKSSTEAIKEELQKLSKENDKEKRVTLPWETIAEKWNKFLDDKKYNQIRHHRTDYINPETRKKVLKYWKQWKDFDSDGSAMETLVKIGSKINNSPGLREDCKAFQKSGLFWLCQKGSNDQIPNWQKVVDGHYDDWKAEEDDNIDDRWDC